MGRVTLRENRTAFERIKTGIAYWWTSVGAICLDIVRPQNFDANTHRANGIHKLAHRTATGDRARSRKAGTVMVLSSLSTSLVEDVVRAATGPVWFQLYINKDRGFTGDLVARVAAAGCQALMLTVDTPEWGRRERDVRNSFHLPPGLSAVNLLPSNERGEAIGQSGAGMGQAFAWMLDASRREGRGMVAFSRLARDPKITRAVT
jgi:4-hydroxymandelate oxidase